MNVVKKADLISALRKVGLKKNDSVYTQSQLYSVGKPEKTKTRDEFCSFFLDGVRHVIGCDGTIVVPTMSTQVGRSPDIYNPKTTVSNYGTLPEYVALHPKFKRSLHPLISVAAQGPLADEICGEDSTNNFNVHSPFEKMVRYGAKNLFIGVPLTKAMQLIQNMFTS